MRTTKEPLDEPAFLLADAYNVYSPDPDGAAGFYARPGLSLQLEGSALLAAGVGANVTTEAGLLLTTEDLVEVTVEAISANTSLRGQGLFAHTDLSGVTTRFSVVFGRLFRINDQMTTGVDVTPSFPIVIDTSVTTRVFGTSFGDQLIITDGVSRPWLATNLQSTPITGTAIDFDSAGTAWSAFGPFVMYAGSLFCILNEIGGETARTDIAWSNPADASTGWQQTDFDFRWTIGQTSSGALYALVGTNTQLFYFRRDSIGSISGIPGPDLATQHTDDSIVVNVGTLSPQSIIEFGDNIFFTDAMGRPYRLQQGSKALDPIWLNLRSIFDESSAGYSGVNQSVCTAGFDPQSNLYIVAPWSAYPSQSGPATEAYIFSAKSGNYFGRFSIAAGCQIDTFGTFTDINGNGTLVILGSAIAPSVNLAPGGFLWSLNRLSGAGDFLTTEAGLFLTTEDGLDVTAEGSAVDWTDNGTVPTIKVVSTRMGYDPETVVGFDRASALVGSMAVCTVSFETAAMVETAEGSPTPSTVQDGIPRLVCGLSGMQGRGGTATFSPTTADSQWSIHAITAQGVVSLAGPDEA